MLTWIFTAGQLLVIEYLNLLLVFVAIPAGMAQDCD